MKRKDRLAVFRFVKVGHEGKELNLFPMTLEDRSRDNEWVLGFSSP